MRSPPVMVVLLFLGLTFSGCIDSGDNEENTYPNIWERSNVGGIPAEHSAEF